MILDEFGVLLKVVTDTLGLTKTEDGLKKVESQAKKTDSSLSKFSTKLGGFMTGFATFATAAIGSIQATVVGAWAYLDSTIDKVEELQTAEDASIRTTKEQVEMSKKYRENMGLMGKTIDSVKTRIALGFLPTMFELSKTYSEFLNANKELISNGISKLLEWVSKAGQVFTNFIRFIDKLVEGTVGWKGALIGLVAILGVVKAATIAAFVANPITWIIAAIVGLMLIIDDFMTYLDGGESQFGEFWGSMLKWIEENKDAIMSIWNAFKVFGSGVLYVLKHIGSALIDFTVGLIAAFQFLVALFTGNMEYIKLNWDVMVQALLSMFSNFAMLFEPLAQWLIEVFKRVWKSIVEWFSEPIAQLKKGINDWIDDVSYSFSKIFDAIVNPFKEAFDWVSNKWQGLKNMFSSGLNANVNMSDRIGGSGITTNSNRVVNNSSNTNAVINVNGNANPIATGNAVAGKLNKTTQMNFGGMAKA